MDTIVQHLLKWRDSARGVSVRRYQFYRVLMTEPRLAAPYLTLYELRADTADEALKRLSEASSKIRKRWSLHGRDAANGSAIYTLISDTPQP